MFSSRENENWNKFHSKYGNVEEDPADRRSMMKSAMSTMGSSCRGLGKAMASTGASITEPSRGNLSRSPSRGNLSRNSSHSSSRGNLTRSSSSRVLMTKGGKAARGAPARSQSGGLQSLRGALGIQRTISNDGPSSTGASMRNLALSNHSSHAPTKPRRSASPMPPQRRKSPIRPSVVSDEE